MKKVKIIRKTSERPTAHWKWRLADNGWGDTICSRCGYISNNDIHISAKYPFCPNCGSKMSNGWKSVLYERDETIYRYKK